MTKNRGIALALALATPLTATPLTAGTFPDFGYNPKDANYQGPLFLLSQEYPASLSKEAKVPPAFFDKLPKELSSNFEEWRAYMDAAKQYCLEGNAETNWVVRENKVRHWFHMPWQHYGTSGREGVHGLTKEAPIQPQQLAATQVGAGQTYAIGIYNEIGAYTIGQVWKDSQKPNPAATSKPNSFGNGTVVCKALFADVDLNTVPFLANPVLWDAYITDSYSSNNRVMKKVALIQMDVAIRDERVKETGWLFGTFQYNGALAKEASWNNLVPVGIMWGNDPEQTGSEYTNPQPTVTKINPNLKQTAINANTKELPPTHLGWNGRLNGPVDNPQSSCMSCHMTAEYKQLVPMSPLFQAKEHIPAEGSAEWMKWFQNIPAGQPFTPGAQSTDYSLQLSSGLANFESWKCNQGGVFVDEENACAPKEKEQPKTLLKAAPAPEVFPVVR